MDPYITWLPAESVRMTNPSPALLYMAFLMLAMCGAELYHIEINSDEDVVDAAARFSPVGHPVAASRVALSEWTSPLLACASCNAYEQAKAWAAGLRASAATPAAARVAFSDDSPSVVHAE